MNELTQNLWERYGFQDNPFDTRALSFNSESKLSVASAYVSRGDKPKESVIFNNFFRNPGGGRIIIEGDSGVGKTTFVNYHRYLWEKEATESLITPVTEISVQENWNIHTFLISLIGSLAGRLRLDIPEKEYRKDNLYTEISALSGVLIKQSQSYNIGGTVLGSGGSFGKNPSFSVQIGKVTTEKLREYISILVSRVKDIGYSGVTFHLNNMELIAKRGSEKLKSFFEEIRDCLQMESIYYVFVGHKGMFQQIIAPLERVRSIFYNNPILISPLTKVEVKRVIEKRYQLLALPNKTIIRPVEQSVLDSLYDIFNGKIRYLMNAVTSLITNIPESYNDTLDVESAINFLREITITEVNTYISGEELKVFNEVVKGIRFTNSSLSYCTGKSKQSINKYINKFLALNLIFPSDKVGRNRFYEVDPKFMLLRE